MTENSFPGLDPIDAFHSALVFAEIMGAEPPACGKPRWTDGGSCPSCKFVGGRYGDNGDFYDLYFCTDYNGPVAVAEDEHVIEGQEALKSSELLQTAVRLAIAQGVVKADDRICEGAKTFREKMAFIGIEL